MSDPAQRQKLLEMIEQQKELAGRFRNPRRIDAVGGGGYFSLLVAAEDHHVGGRLVALKFADPFKADDYRSRCFRREPEVLEKFVGQRDVIQLVSGPSQFTYMLESEPVTFPITFHFYALELAVYLQVILAMWRRRFWRCYTMWILGWR